MIQKLMEDIVLDTNILMHASNPQELRCTASKHLGQILLNGKTRIVVDEGFDPDMSKNKSMIGHEYFSNITFGSFAFALILKLVSEQRVVGVVKSPGMRAKKIVMQRIRKPIDRVFVYVTCNSQERTFVSHDFEDFPEEKRLYLRRELGIAVVTATVAAGLNW
jgi:hypothetical protein